MVYTNNPNNTNTNSIANSQMRSNKKCTNNAMELVTKNYNKTIMVQHQWTQSNMNSTYYYAPSSSDSSCGSSSSSSNSSNSTYIPTNHKNRAKKSKKRNKATTQQPQQLPQSSSPKPQFVAMDCEMVGVGMDGLDSALARVTIMDWDSKVVLDQYVKPDQPVVDYRTHVSGITPTDLDHSSVVTLRQCRALVLEIIRNKVLIGHGLRNDLEVLGIYNHPWYMIRDTALYEPYMKVRYPAAVSSQDTPAASAVLWPRKLKELCQDFLNKTIQPYGVPHSSQEDACAALDLYKLVAPTWEAAMKYQIMKTALSHQPQIQYRAQFPPMQPPHHYQQYQQQFTPLQLQQQQQAVAFRNQAPRRTITTTTTTPHVITAVTAQ